MLAISRVETPPHEQLEQWVQYPQIGLPNATWESKREYLEGADFTATVDGHKVNMGG